MKIKKHSSPRWVRTILATILAVAGITAGTATATVVTNTATRDNWITDFISGGQYYYDTANYGSSPKLAVGYTLNGQVKSLIGFNVTMTNLPYVVNSVTLRLHVQERHFDSSSNYNNNVYAISAANGNWVEGTGINYNVNASDSTWNYKSGPPATSNAWAGAGGLSTPVTDYDSNVLSSVTFSPSSQPALNSVVDFVFSGTPAQLTTLIQGWTNNMPGLLLQTSTPDPSPTANLDWMAYHSREETTSGTGAYRPQLLIDFTVIPEPSSLMLLALGGLLLARRRQR